MFSLLAGKWAVFCIQIISKTQKKHKLPAFNGYHHYGSPSMITISNTLCLMLTNNKKIWIQHRIMKLCKWFFIIEMFRKCYNIIYIFYLTFLLYSINYKFQPFLMFAIDLFSKGRHCFLSSSRPPCAQPWLEWPFL